MGLTVNELLARLSREELIEWLAFFFLEPWGCAQEDYRFGVIAAQFHNAHSSGAPLKPSDFFPPHSEQERRDLIRRNIRNTLHTMRK